MNILAFVLAILMILSYSALASFQKHAASRRSQSAFIGLRKAERSLLRQSEIKTFKETDGTLLKPLGNKLQTTKPKEVKPISIPPVNPACCRLNLYPIIQEGKEIHGARYKLAAKMLRLFYEKELKLKKGMEYQLLDSIIEAAKFSIKDQTSLPLETLALADKTLQPLYYLLLKGTKHADLFAGKGYLPLIDYFKIDKDDSPICLFHAHPNMLASFFGLKETLQLYEKLHREVKGGIELEALLLLVSDPMIAFQDQSLWELLDLKKPKHKSLSLETLVAEDKETGISIRNTISS